MRKIIASPTHSPLPVREHDFCAHYEGEEEVGNYGYGATEAEAIKDFVENCQEAHDERLGTNPAEVDESLLVSAVADALGLGGGERRGEFFGACDRALEAHSQAAE
jgi:hypothetical protein